MQFNNNNVTILQINELQRQRFELCDFDYWLRPEMNFRKIQMDLRKYIIIYEVQVIYNNDINTIKRIKR